MTEKTPFELSRLYAAGWAQGKKCTAEDDDGLQALIAATAAELNPNHSEAERERWISGFTDAVQRQRGQSVAPRKRP